MTSQATKVVCALTSPHPGLRDLALRDALAAAGATRFQVNVDDEPVADAMRFGPDPTAPVRAVLSAWVEDDARLGRVLDVLLAFDTADDGRAWLVEEHVRLAPDDVVDGRRVDALANVALLRRPATMTHQEWLTDWLGRHTAVAIETQATFGYVQNPVVEHLTPGGRDVAGIVEELFSMAGISDPHAFYGSGGDQAELDRRLTVLLDSCARFGASEGLDLVPTSRYDYNLG